MMTFDNFTIRQLSKGDSQNYFSLVHRNHKRISSYFPVTVKSNKNIKATVAHVELRLQLAKKKELFTFIILDDKTEKIIGTVFIKDIDWTIPKGEFGFFIDSDYEGKGIITKSISMMIDYCFGKLKMN